MEGSQGSMEREQLLRYRGTIEIPHAPTRWRITLKVEKQRPRSPKRAEISRALIAREATALAATFASRPEKSDTRTPFMRSRASLRSASMP
ncbi:MAG: hypothetical protein D6691_04570 [Candidatus Hydrogenedentota bacterium]|nr:MAG: hypothetical protein D6691_04570 [Candidatus Hydrogenedentota bacterium]